MKNKYIYINYNIILKMCPPVNVRIYGRKKVPSYYIAPESTLQPSRLTIAILPDPAPAPAAVNPKYIIKVERPILSKKGGKKIGTAYYTLDTNKIRIDKNGKSGTISCEVRAIHQFTDGNDSYNVHLIGATTLNLGVSAAEDVIDAADPTKHIRGVNLKAGYLKPTGVFINNVELNRAVNKKIDVTDGIHTVSPIFLTFFQWIALNLGG